MSNINQPVTNPKLKSYLAAMRKADTEQTRSRVLQEIAEHARFLSIVNFSQEPAPREDSTAVISKNTQLEFPMLQTPEGNSYCAAFTDWEELNKWEFVKPGQKAIPLTFDSYLALLEEDSKISGIVIDPFGENLVLDRTVMQHLKACRNQQ